MTQFAWGPTVGSAGGAVYDVLARRARLLGAAFSPTPGCAGLRGAAHDPTSGRVGLRGPAQNPTPRRAMLPAVDHDANAVVLNLRRVAPDATPDVTRFRDK